MPATRSGRLVWDATCATSSSRQVTPRNRKTRPSRYAIRNTKPATHIGSVSGFMAKNSVAKDRSGGDGTFFRKCALR